jgi:tetratricopeptide (TPR) repeat protein
VTERRDVLSACFLLLAIIAYLRAFPPGSIRAVSRAAYAASIALLALSLLSKAWGMSFFVIVTILDWYPLRRLPIDPRRWRDRALIPIYVQKLPFAALGIAAALMAGYAQRSAPGAMRTLEQWSIAQRAAQAAYGLVFYPFKTLWPTDLSPLYEIPRGLDPLAPRYLLCYTLIAAAAILLYALRRRAPALLAAAAVYAVLIAPVLGIAQSGDQLVADRYSYVSMIAPIIALAGALLLLPARRVALAAGALALVPLSVLTWNQARIWRDSLSLWSHAVRAAPGPLTHSSYALNLVNTRPDDPAALREAIAHYEAAIAIDPEDGRAWYLLAKARQEIDPASAIEPYTRAAALMPQAYIPWVDLGVLYKTRLHDDARALESFRAAVRDLETPRTGPYADRPLSGVPYMALGSALRDSADPAGARAAFESATRFPDTRDRAIERLRALPPP